MTTREFATSVEVKRFDNFLQELRSRGRSLRTLRAYEIDWGRFADWYQEVNGEPFTLDRLAALDVTDHLSWGAENGLKPNTLNRRLTFLKGYTTWGVEQGVVSSDQERRIRKLSMRKTQQLAPKSLTSQEVRKLIKAVELRGNPRDEAIIKTLLYTGLRIGELVELKLSDIQMSERKGTVLIRGEIAKGRKEREVPLPKAARDTLAAYLADKPLQDEAGPLWRGRQGPLSTEGIAAVVTRYADWAGLESVTPHVLRHTFAYSYLANNNNDLVALADILGHSDLNTTRMYTRRHLRDLQEGSENVKFY